MREILVQGSFLQEKSGSKFRFLPWAILLGLLIGIAGVWSSNKEVLGLFHDDGIYAVVAKSLHDGAGYRIISLPTAPDQTKYPFLYSYILSWLWSLDPKFPDNIGLLKAANAAFLAVIFILSGHAMQKSWNFAVVEAMDSILSANRASQDLQASTFRQRLFRNIGKPPPCMFVIAGSYPSMTPPRTFVIVQGGLHHLKTLPDDLQQTFSEAARVLRDNGTFVVVEPWLTILGLCPYSMSKKNRQTCEPKD